MTAPEVRYCMTSDGVRIAYTVTGAGPPHVFVSDPAGSHVQLEWSHTTLGPEYTELARHNTLIRLDLRGSGLSDRTLPSDIDDWAVDVEAVVARLGIDVFSLTAVISAVPSMIMLAARLGDRIHRLVFLNGYASGTGSTATPQGQALLALTTIDYTLATELVGLMAFGTGRDEVRDQGAYTRACVGPEYLESLPRIAGWDASAACASVRAPTLILQHARIAFVTDAMARDLAARIPDARLSVLDRGLADDPVGDGLRVAEFINDRAIERAGAAPATAAGPASGTAVILYADIADSTALTERLGDAAFRDRARTLDAALRDLIRANGGQAIEGKLLGDGVLATFPSAAQAIAAALAYEGAASASELALHVGLHAGDVMRETDPSGRNNIFGGTVNIAARIGSLAAPGEVLVSDVVRALARTSAGVTFEDRGEHALKGVADPQRLWAVVGAPPLHEGGEGAAG